jgi:uncharacterized protein (DUF2336 family)
MNTQAVLIDELNDALVNSSAGRRTEMVQRLADLFVFGSSEFSTDQINLFDDVFTTLVCNIEASARTSLAVRLATSPATPPAISRALAFDDVIDVAAPMLEFSEGIDSKTLVENARTKSQDHLLAISRRRTLDAIVTDVLVERGDRLVVLTTVENLGARFSDFGFMTLVKRSEGDDELASCVGYRRELPRHYLLKLLTKASDAVRAKLEFADPLSSDTIRNAVAEAVNLVQTKTTGASRNYAMARAYVESLQAAGRLGEGDVEAFAKTGKFEETTVALALLCNLPIEQVELAMAGDRPETVLILTKAIGISWPTVKALLAMRLGGNSISSRELEQCLGTFSRLKPETARQVMEFHRKRAAGRIQQGMGK